MCPRQLPSATERSYKTRWSTTSAYFPLPPRLLAVGLPLSFRLRSKPFDHALRHPPVVLSLGSSLRTGFTYIRAWPLRLQRLSCSQANERPVCKDRLRWHGTDGTGCPSAPVLVNSPNNTHLSMIGINVETLLVSRRFILTLQDNTNRAKYLSAGCIVGLWLADGRGSPGTPLKVNRMVHWGPCTFDCLLVSASSLRVAHLRLHAVNTIRHVFRRCQASSGRVPGIEPECEGVTSGSACPFPARV